MRRLPARNGRGPRRGSYFQLPSGRQQSPVHFPFDLPGAQASASHRITRRRPGSGADGPSSGSALSTGKDRVSGPSPWFLQRNSGIIRKTFWNCMPSLCQGNPSKSDLSAMGLWRNRLSPIINRKSLEEAQAGCVPCP